MTRIVVLDAGPLGLLCMPPTTSPAMACSAWMTHHTMNGTSVVVPEITDYEVRRELLRLGHRTRLQQLDRMLRDDAVRYLPLTTRAMRLAAQLWADARREGRPTADRHALDVDVILAAQTRLLIEEGYDAMVATTNVRLLTRFVPAAEWPGVV